MKYLYKWPSIESHYWERRYLTFSECFEGVDVSLAIWRECPPRQPIQKLMIWWIGGYFSFLVKGMWFECRVVKRSWNYLRCWYFISNLKGVSPTAAYSEADDLVDRWGFSFLVKGRWFECRVVKRSWVNISLAIWRECPPRQPIQKLMIW